MTLDYLTCLYKSDPEVVAAYHGNVNWTPEQCAKDTYNNLLGLEFHKMDYGYICINRFDLIPRLAGFFIVPEYRNKETKERFFNDLYSLMPNKFMATVHSGNTKGIKFLSLKGEITLNDNITTYIVFRQEKF